MPHRGFARALFVTNMKSAMATRRAFILQAAFMALNNAVYFTFWWVLMRRVPDVRGWTLADIELLYGLTATSFGVVVAVAGGVRHLAECIEEAELDALLVQPRPTLVYALGMRSRASGFGDVVSGLAFIALSGRATPATVPLLALAIACASAAILGSGIAFFSLAFWLHRAESIARGLWELMLTFSLYPEPLFGGTIRLLLFTLLPAGFVGYLPAGAVRHPSATAVALMVGGAVACLAAGCAIFAIGLRRYASGSRFVTFG